MPELLELLAAGLERQREITSQVHGHLTETYGLSRDAIGAFLLNELPALEDYEVDLILSPLFTPTLHEQAVVADALGRESVPKQEWPALVQQLLSRPVHATLLADDGQKLSVPLRDVAIERFVHRLRLEGSISEPLFSLIQNLAPAGDRALLKAIARRAVWESDARREILARYLTVSAGGGHYRLDDAVGLLKLAETYQPAGVKDLLAHIPHWQKVVQQEINEAASPKPFFNERVQELHGGGRDQRRQQNSRVAAKEAEQAFLERLQNILAA